jgi:hypothetical protein
MHFADCIKRCTIGGEDLVEINIGTGGVVARADEKKYHKREVCR